MDDKIRLRIAVGLVVAAAVMWALDGKAPAPDAPPLPPDSAPLTLRGLFVGPTAAEDANTVACLSREIADEIAWDGEQAKPLYTSGSQLDELRTRARVLRCKGVKIGDRQPKVRDAIHAYLDDAVGVSGGPVTPEQRRKWVDAYIEIGRAAGDATK
jgi:hypothetical protein